MKNYGLGIIGEAEENLMATSSEYKKLLFESAFENDLR